MLRYLPASLRCFLLVPDVLHPASMLPCSLMTMMMWPLSLYHPCSTMFSYLLAGCMTTSWSHSNGVLAGLLLVGPDLVLPQDCQLFLLLAWACEDCVSTSSLDDSWELVPEDKFVSLLAGPVVGRDGVLASLWSVGHGLVLTQDYLQLLFLAWAGDDGVCISALNTDGNNLLLFPGLSILDVIL